MRTTIRGNEGGVSDSLGRLLVPTHAGRAPGTTGRISPRARPTLTLPTADLFYRCLFASDIVTALTAARGVFYLGMAAAITFAQACLLLRVIFTG